LCAIVWLSGHAHEHKIAASVDQLFVQQHQRNWSRNHVEDTKYDGPSVADVVEKWDYYDQIEEEWWEVDGGSLKWGQSCKEGKFNAEQPTYGLDRVDAFPAMDRPHEGNHKQDVVEGVCGRKVSKHRIYDQHEVHKGDDLENSTKRKRSQHCMSYHVSYKLCVCIRREHRVMQWVPLSLLKHTQMVEWKKQKQ
jgi:hypothetical protein